MKKLSYTIDFSMVKDTRGVVEVSVGNQRIVRVGNNTDFGVNLRTGKRTALTMAAKMLRDLADQMDQEARDA